VGKSSGEKNGYTSNGNEAAAGRKSLGREKTTKTLKGGEKRAGQKKEKKKLYTTRNVTRAQKTEAGKI